MALSDKQKKIDDYLDVAVFPPASGPLSNLDWQIIIRIGFKAGYTVEEMALEYHACLKALVNYLQENKLALINFNALHTTKLKTLPSLVQINSLPNPIFLNFLIASALEFLVKDLPHVSIHDMYDAVLNNKALMLPHSDADFMDCIASKLTETKILNRISKPDLSLPESQGSASAALSDHSVLQFKKPNQAELQTQLNKLNLSIVSGISVKETIALIDDFEPNLLNTPNSEHITPLLYAVSYQKTELAIYIAKKLVQADFSLDIPNDKGHNSLDYNPELLLKILVDRYSEYACSDYLRFPTVVCPGKGQWLAAKSNAITEAQSHHEATANQSAHPNYTTGSYTVYQIKNVANEIYQARSGCCTTFAIALANQLLKYLPSTEFQILAYSNKLSSHCFISLTTSRGEFILDPWLASLGWETGVYSKEQYPWQDALRKTSVVFDSKNTDKLKITL